MQAAVDNLTFEEWWAELGDAVRAWLLRRRVPPHLVDDIVQETGLRLFKMWDEIDAMRSPRGLAFTIASNLLWDERNRRASREIVGDVPEQSREDVEAAGMARLELARVRRAMNRLNPQQRAVLLAEIGDATGPTASPDAVKMMRMRARRRLTAILDSAPAGLFVFVRMPKRWWRAARSAQRSTVMQLPTAALVATCTTIAIVGIPPSEVAMDGPLQASAARPLRVHAAASAATTGVSRNVPASAGASRVAGTAKPGGGVSIPPAPDVTVEVGEGTPVSGSATVIVEPSESFELQPPECTADPEGPQVHVKCGAQVGDQRVEADTVVGVDP